MSRRLGRGHRPFSVRSWILKQYIGACKVSPPIRWIRIKLQRDGRYCGRFAVAPTLVEGPLKRNSNTEEQPSTRPRRESNNRAQKRLEFCR
jgi:hypothetical protein